MNKDKIIIHINTDVYELKQVKELQNTIINRMLDNTNELAMKLDKIESNSIPTKCIEDRISDLEKQKDNTNNELIHTRLEYYIQAYKELIDEFRGSN